MSPGNIDQTPDTSYAFFDEKTKIRVVFYATGAIELKDCEILTETDSLEVRLPSGEAWIFQLFEHIYSEHCSIKEEINATRTQTIIELEGTKQQPLTPWPQLYSYNSTPTTPQRNVQHVKTNESSIASSVSLQSPHEISIKKLKTHFSETNETVRSSLLIPQVYNCTIQFTETNFNITFQTNDEQFLQQHSIPSKVLLKLFIRVKERIVPDQCNHSLTPTYIDIVLVKANLHRSTWTRLEPDEYSEIRTLPQSSGLTFASNINTKSLMNNLNTVLVQSIERQSDTFPSTSLSSTAQKSIAFKVPVTSLVGFTGIYNPANSCFMNAAIQCLSNTRELRDYFLQSYYISELNPTNPLGMKGAMAEELGALVKNLWAGNSKYIFANRLRSFAAERHQEFVGNGQHDAQELLTVVLDAVHEDLNRVISKPQVPPIDDQNRPDHIVADEYWRGYLSRNNSIVVQLFTGQFKSKTTCPQCLKESVTFDPFTSLSVPVPKRISVDTIVIFRSTEKAPRKYRILMSADGSIKELKRRLSLKCGLLTSKMSAHKIRAYSIVEHLKDDDPASTNSFTWNSSDSIFVTEILSSAECNNEPIRQLTFTQRIFKLPDYISACAYCQASPNLFSLPKFCIHCYRVCYCNAQCEKFHADEHKMRCRTSSTDNYEIIGLPFIISLPESKFTCKNVFEQIHIHAKRSVDIHIDCTKHTRRSFTLSDDLDINEEENEDDSFRDIENVDWATIKTSLASSDAWSICRLGDYFVRTYHNKRQRCHEKDRQEKLLQTESIPTDESMIINDEADSHSSTEDFDMLDDIYGNQLLFRLMPQTLEHSHDHNQSIIEASEDGDQILRYHTDFFIDWFTDNKEGAPLRVTSSEHRSGINNLIDDDSIVNAGSADQDITLSQCLQIFIEPEVLGPDDKWYCPHCKEHIQAEKKMSIWRLPPILIIHLKRFKYNHCSSYGYVSNSREKIDTTVKFPIHDLDMAPFCSSLPETNSNFGDPSQSRYDLYGLINHRGTAWFGHYTSCARLLAYNDSAKTELGWRQFDDDRVSAFANDKDLVRSDAYVLFYRHRHLPVNLVLPERLESLSVQ